MLDDAARGQTPGGAVWWYRLTRFVLVARIERFLSEVGVTVEASRGWQRAGKGGNR